MKQERVTCRECGLEGAIGNMYKLELYDKVVIGYESANR